MNLPKNKDELIAELHQQIDAASRKLDELKLQAKLGKADAEDALQERIGGLEARKHELTDEMEKLKRSAGDAWQELGEGCQRSWAEFKDAITKAANEFKS